MPDQPFDPDAVIDALAPLLGLEVRPEERPGVAANLRVTARFAAILFETPVADEAEPAPVFRA